MGEFFSRLLEGRRGDDTTSEATKTHSAAAAAEFENIRHELGQLREDFVRLAKTLVQDAKEEVPGEARRLFEQLSETGNRSAKAIAHEIEERPLTSLLLAFGAGFIGGSLLLR